MYEYAKKTKHLVYAAVLLSIISVGCETTNVETQQKQRLSAEVSGIEQKAVREQVIQLNTIVYEAYNVGDYKTALEYINRAIKIEPTFARSYTNRAAIYFMQGKYKQAIEETARSISLDPEDAQPYYIRGAAYCFIGKYWQAIDSTSAAIAIDPALWDAYNYRGVAYGQLGDYDKALEDLMYAIDIAIETRTISYTCYVNRGYIYLKQKKYDKALADLTEAIRLNSQDAEAYHLRAQVYKHLKQDERSAADAQEAAHLEPH